MSQADKAKPLRSLKQRPADSRADAGVAAEMPGNIYRYVWAISGWHQLSLVVLTVAVMHHIADADDVRRTLAEMVRVSKPGGRGLIWDHNPRNPYWSLLMARVPQDTGEERLIPEREVVAGLHAAGAVIMLSTQLGLVPDFVPPRALPAEGKVRRRTRAERRALS